MPGMPGMGGGMFGGGNQPGFRGQGGSPKTEIVYPDSDGKPMADNTRQFRWITTIKSNLDWLFANNADVFVAGDLLWYPVEGDNKTRQAPDVMVAFGRPKGERGSYQQWKENNIPPQVVFEILSPGNTATEMTRKLLFYDRYGVEEYYIYNPDKNDLGGCIRRENRLESRENLDNWVSPRLGIRFHFLTLSPSRFPVFIAHMFALSFCLSLPHFYSIFNTFYLPFSIFVLSAFFIVVISLILESKVHGG